METEPIILQAETGRLSGTRIATALPGYSGTGYVTGFEDNDSFWEIDIDICEAGFYKLVLRHASIHGSKPNYVFLNGHSYGELMFSSSDQFTDLDVCETYMAIGTHTLRIAKFYGNIEVDSLKIIRIQFPQSLNSSFRLSNPFASDQCKALMDYFADIYGKRIITGQHTSAANGPEIDHIYQATGQLPALRGFDLLSYSLNTNSRNGTDSCLNELANNKGSVEKAIEWSCVHGGIVTFCWHWFSPIGGMDKSFYTKNTDFDLKTALIPNTSEYQSLVADIDAIGKALSKLCEARIPVIWRPLHEADGKWFWWGAKGSQEFLRLWQLMYERLTDYHKLNNLIWVWSAQKPKWYPGDEWVDIVGMDIYAPDFNYGPLKCCFDHSLAFTKGRKPVALTENGPIPDPDLLVESKAAWLWYLTWWGKIGERTSAAQLNKVFHNPYCVTLGDYKSRNKPGGL